MAEQPRLDVLDRQRLAQERVVEEVDLADRQVVGRAPVGVDERELVRLQGVGHAANRRSLAPGCHGSDTLPRLMSRLPLAGAVLALLVLVLSGSDPANGATTRTCHTPKGKVVRYRGVKRPKACVKVKAPKKPKAGAPAAPAPPEDGPAGEAATLTVRPGSAVTLDLGGGRIRTFPLQGTLRGFLVGAYRPGTDTAITFTRGALSVGPTDTLMDDCPAPALARTDPATVVMLDPSKASPLTISAAGAVLLKINMLVRVVLDLRGDAGCGGAPATSGYADTSGTVALGGTTGAPLAPFALSSHPFPLRLNACYVPGSASSPCAFAPTGLLTTASVALDGDLDLG
jgi:hypothetical protein